MCNTVGAATGEFFPPEAPGFGRTITRQKWWSIANRDSHFNVLGCHCFNQQTAIILLHLPDDERWKLFEKVHLSLEEDILNRAIYSFETKIQLPPIPELTTNDWLKRCEFPLGVDNNGEPWPL